MRHYKRLQFSSSLFGMKGLKGKLRVVNKVGLPIYLLITLTVLMILPPLGFAQTKPYLVVEPREKEFGPYPVVGTEFSVNVWIKNVSSTSNLVNVTFTLRFNSTLLEALNATEGSFMRGLYSPFRDTTFRRLILPDRIVISNYLNLPYTTYPSGEGIIAERIYFSIKYQGVDPDVDTSPLSLIDIALIGNTTPPNIPYESPINGQVTIKGLISTEISVTNPETGNNDFIYTTSDKAVGGKFNATIKIKDVADLFAFEVRLNYNSTQLNATRAWLPTTNPEYVFYGRTTIAIPPILSPGTVQIADTIITGASFNGTGLMAIIELKILLTPPSEGRLSSKLDIDNIDTFLEDSNGADIPTAKTNGNYEYLLPGVSFITINVNPNETSVGSNVTISGKITPIKANVNVTIHYRLNKTGEIFTNLSEVKTDTSSNYNYIWTTTTNGTFELYSSWPGDADTNPANSTSTMPNPLVTVKLTSTITVDVDPKTVDALFNVTISGYIDPAKTGVTVTMYYRLNRTGEKWAVLGTAPTNLTGNYTLLWTAKKKTTNQTDKFEIKSGWSGDEEIAAVNSTITMLTVNRVPTQIAISIDSSTIALGQNVTISGKITPTRQYSGVEIFYNTTRIDPLIPINTNMTGHFSHTWKPLKNATYMLKAKWGGNANLFENESATTRLTVTPPVKASSTITASVDITDPTVKSNVTIRGTIQPKPKLASEVRIQYFDGVVWAELNLLGRYGKPINTNQDGNFTFTWMAGYIGDIIQYDPKNITRIISIEDKWKTGTFILRAKWGGNETVQGAESPTINVTVNPFSSTLTINADPPTVNVGSNVTISGTLAPVKANTNITIYYRRSGTDSSWSVLATTQTDSNSFYNYTWTTIETGEFELHANWRGDDLTRSANSTTATLTAVQPFTILTYLPYIAGAVIIILVLAIVALYMLKFRKP